jgi:hypothetical protein
VGGRTPRGVCSCVTVVEKPRVYVFVTGRTEAGWLQGVALGEDGVVLGGRCAASRDWLRFYLGLDSTLMHHVYRAHYHRGYELVEVADDELSGHFGLLLAIQRNRDLDLGSLSA